MSKKLVPVLGLVALALLGGGLYCATQCGTSPATPPVETAAKESQPQLETPAAPVVAEQGVARVATAGKAYLLQVKGPEGQARLPLTIGAEGNRVRLASANKPDWTVEALSKLGSYASNEDLGPLASLLSQANASRVELPGGGWLQVQRKEKEIPAPRAGVIARRVEAKVRGALSSGERFMGKLRGEVLFAESDRALVALRAKEELTFEHQGAKTFEFKLDQASQPKSGERKVGQADTRFPILPQGSPVERQARFAGVKGLSIGSALMLAGALTLVTFVLLMLGKWLGSAKLLCLVLALAFVLAPMAPLAHGDSWWKRFSDPTRDEIGWTAVSVLVTGLGATVAAVTAPAWVPVAIGAAGVAAIGAYWVTREPPIRSGTIVTKRYEPPNTYLTFIPITTTSTTVVNGTTQVNTTVTMTPMWVYDDEDHVIVIEEGGRDRTLYLSPEEFARVEKGQHYDMDAGEAKSEDDNEKRKATAAERRQLEEAKSRGEERIELETKGGVKQALGANTR